MGAKESNLFAIRLLRLRHIEGLTQKKLAKKLNLSRSCIANYERGKRYPDQQTLMLMAKYFRVSLQYMTGEIAAEEIVPATTGIAQTAKNLMCDDWLDIGGLTLVQRTSIRDYLEYLKACENTAE